MAKAPDDTESFAPGSPAYMFHQACKTPIQPPELTTGVSRTPSSTEEKKEKPNPHAPGMRMPAALQRGSVNKAWRPLAR